MAQAISIKLEGTEAMQNALKEFKDDTFKKKVLTSAYRKAAKPFVKTAKANAPIAERAVMQGGGRYQVDPGTLKKSVGAWTYRKLKSPHLFMGARFGKRSLKYDGWYYRFVEFGTVFQAAKPFLQPAWNATVGAAGQILNSEFTGVLNKFKNKYGIK